MILHCLSVNVLSIFVEIQSLLINRLTTFIYLHCIKSDDINRVGHLFLVKLVQSSSYNSWSCEPPSSNFIQNPETKWRNYQMNIIKQHQSKDVDLYSLFKNKTDCCSNHCPNVNTFQKEQKRNTLPCENITGTHTSTVAFNHEFGTQWYPKSSGFVHDWTLARFLHCFFWIALDRSSSLSGQEGT